MLSCGSLDAMALQPRRLAAEGDGELGIAGDRLHGERQCALERGSRSFAILGHGDRQEIATCAVDSGNSSPKQRW